MIKHRQALRQKNQDKNMVVSNSNIKELKNKDIPKQYTQNKVNNATITFDTENESDQEEYTQDELLEAFLTSNYADDIEEGNDGDDEHDE